MIKLNYHRELWSTGSGIRKFLTPEEYYQLHGWNAPSYPMVMLLSPFQPFLAMSKDMIDTFKPYKGYYQSNRDFLLPVRGLANIVGSILVLAIMLVTFAGTLLAFMVKACFLNIDTNHLKYLGIVTGATAETISRILKGITQVAFTPLCWFIKMPLRGLITAITGVPKIEENSQLINWAKEGHRFLDAGDIDGTRRIIKMLNARFSSAIEKGQSTTLEAQHRDFRMNINAFVEGRNVEANQLSNYLELFAPRQNMQKFCIFAYGQKTNYAREQDKVLEAEALPDDVLAHIGGFISRL
jgi:hypothetical protein